MDANRPVTFVPAEGIEQVLLAPIAPERKIAILLSAIGHDVKLEGLEGVVAESIKAQISRFNAKYDLAVQRRNERQKKYRDAKREASQAPGITHGNATPDDITLHNAPQRDVKNPPESESESESESPQSPPAGGITRPTVDPVRSAGEAPEKKNAAPPAQPEGRTRHFRAPSAEEVAAYAASRGEAIDAERFVDFYASKGWKVGRAPMRDWQAAVRNWLRDRGDFVPQKKDAAPPAQTPDPLAMPAAETAAERMERWAREAAAARAAAGTEPAAAAGGRE